MSLQRTVPAWQQAIIDKCYHPTGRWEEFPESEYESSVPARFEKIVARFPEQIAIVDDQRSLTYAELNGAANRVAHGLLERLGFGSEPVAHLFEQGVEAVIALLGILKAGKFYVPLDTRSPVEHLRAMISLLESRLLLTDELNRKLAEKAAEGLTVVGGLAEVTGEVDINPGVAIGPDDTLYLILTSGSTGVPKGVIENHRNALRYSAQYVNSCHLSVQDRNLLAQRLSFSGSVNVFYGSLLFGSPTFVYDIHRQGIANLPAWIAQHSLTIITFTPSVFRLLAEVTQDVAAFASVRLLRHGGDCTLATDIAAYGRLLPETAILRIGLGASEAKGIAELLYDKESAGRMPELSVGWPVHDVDVLILDEEGNQLAPGATGEIVAYSRFISPGYWKAPELTRQKFRSDPDRPGFVYYFTGDLGRMEADGSLTFLGRADSRVKIHGQQVEVGEVETLLRSVEGVRNAVVALDERIQADPSLVAWLVWNEQNQSLTNAELRQRLAAYLPPYMIPTHFIALPQLPLTANGKVDRRNLPMPGRFRPHLAMEYRAAQTPIEQKLVHIWCQVLSLDEIGIDDPFLELGGDSLKAMRVLARVATTFQLELTPSILFAASTVAEMALVITAALASEMEITQGGAAGESKR